MEAKEGDRVYVNTGDQILTATFVRYEADEALVIVSGQVVRVEASAVNSPSTPP